MNRVEQTLEIIRKQPGINRAELSRILGCAPRTAGVHLNKAMHTGLVRATGVGRYTTWHPVNVNPPSCNIFYQ